MSLQVKLIRVARGVRAKRLATRLGISPSYLSEIELSRKVPTKAVQVKIAKALGVSRRVLWPNARRSHG